MGIAKILAPVTGGQRDAAVLSYAIEAAKPFNAHVMALFVRPDLSEALAFFTDGVSGVVVEEVVKATRDAADEASKRIEATLASVCAATGVERVAAPVRSPKTTVSLRDLQGNFGDQLTSAARLSDLVVFGHLAENEQAGLAEAFVQVLVETDRPVLLARDTPPAVFAKRIVIGWNGRNAAAQAVSAAIPYLQHADSVEILSVQRPPLNTERSEVLKEYLSLHGVTATERVVDPGQRRVGEVLLESASQNGADLLVVGGYGHGRLRESLIGGVTRQLIAQAGLAVFMVH